MSPLRTSHSSRKNPHRPAPLRPGSSCLACLALLWTSACLVPASLHSAAQSSLLGDLSPDLSPHLHTTHHPASHTPRHSHNDRDIYFLLWNTVLSARTNSMRRLLVLLRAGISVPTTRNWQRKQKIIMINQSNCPSSKGNIDTLLRVATWIMIALSCSFYDQFHMLFADLYKTNTVLFTFTLSWEKLHYSLKNRTRIIIRVCWFQIHLLSVKEIALLSTKLLQIRAYMVNPYFW